ncbi:MULTISPECIES: thioredoxin fold domain-containing protein [Ramlibacter]|uniref:Thioredoxin fold domain-containing protein n=1 Tax=Ramlibacter aquaticus TaxID=2780094 RepID=A0ABR9SIA5_9BURK|nr:MULTISPECIES: thioredoxin fold domain-containing protein [Ramlibacter]MBE7941462.1 thioredoxin fold domain-containing protein [Ramlibacter aquaticus]
MKALKFAVAALASLALLAGCGNKDDASSSTGGADASKPAEAVSIEAIQAEGTGFTVGSPMSVKTVYVFFDPQCPHCSALWYAAKPIKAVKFIWMPVRFINDASLHQGATIIAAKDPIATMDEHEALLTDRKGGITAASGVDAQEAAVKKNTALMTRFGFQSIPTIITKNAQGSVVSHEGALPTADLAAFVGVPVPSAQ